MKLGVVVPAASSDDAPHGLFGADDFAPFGPARFDEPLFPSSDGASAGGRGGAGGRGIGEMPALPHHSDAEDGDALGALGALGGMVGHAEQLDDHAGATQPGHGDLDHGTEPGSPAPGSPAGSTHDDASLGRVLALEDTARQRLCAVIDTINRITATTTQPDAPPPPPDDATAGMPDAQRAVWARYASAAHDVVQAQRELDELLASYADVLGCLLARDGGAPPPHADVLARLGIRTPAPAKADGGADDDAPEGDEGWVREARYWFRSREGFLHFVPSDTLDPGPLPPGAPRPAITRYRMPPLEAFYDGPVLGGFPRPELGPDAGWDQILPLVRRSEFLWHTYPIPTLGQFSPQNADPADPKFWSDVETGIVRLWAYYKVDAETPSLSTLRRHFGSSWLTNSQMRSRWKRLQEIQRHIEARVEAGGESIFAVARDLAAKMKSYRTGDGRENPICSLAMLSDLLVAERTHGVGAHIPKRPTKKRKTDAGAESAGSEAPGTPELA